MENRCHLTFSLKKTPILEHPQVREVSLRLNYINASRMVVRSEEDIWQMSGGMTGA